jgi:beta-glucosidase
LQDPYASATRPVRELKGFHMVELAPGESKQVNFTLTEADLKFYNAKQQWVAEPGTFHVYIGGDSSVKEKRSFELK